MIHARAVMLDTITCNNPYGRLAHGRELCAVVSDQGLRKHHFQICDGVTSTLIFFSPLGHIASAVRHLESMFSVTAIVRAIHAHLVKSHRFTTDGTEPALCRKLI